MAIGGFDVNNYGYSYVLFIVACLGGIITLIYRIYVS